MSAVLYKLPSFADMWKVLMLFLIPIGGGIPGGVLLVKSKSMAWPLMMILYLISDIILACLFEPIMLLFIVLGRRVPVLARISAVFKQVVQKTTAHYGSSAGPLALIMIAFGVDPMTGRAAAVAAGHGFVVGWIIAITGDMLYFTLLMVSTLWLNSVLGDGTWTMVIILVLMMLFPYLIRSFRRDSQKSV